MPLPTLPQTVTSILQQIGWVVGSHTIPGPDPGWQTYNAKAYGVAWDGVTDDSAALNTLISLVSAVGGGEIQLPLGTGLIKSNVQNKAGVTISGHGLGTVIKTSGAITAINLTEGYDQVARDFVVQGDATALDGIQVSGGTRIGLERVQCLGFTNLAAGRGLLVQGSLNHGVYALHALHCNFSTNYIGVEFTTSDAPAQNNRANIDILDSCTIYNNVSDGVLVNYANQIECKSCDVENNGGFGYRVINAIGFTRNGGWTENNVLGGMGYDVSLSNRTWYCGRSIDPVLTLTPFATDGVTDGTTTITATGIASTDVGYTIVVAGAGASGLYYKGTIATAGSGTCTISGAAPPTNVTGANVWILNGANGAQAGRGVFHAYDTNFGVNEGGRVFANSLLLAVSMALGGANPSASKGSINTITGGGLIVSGTTIASWSTSTPHWSFNGKDLGNIGNLQIGSTNAFGGGVGVLGIRDATTVPTTNPASGTVIYSEAGALKARGSSGTVTTIAPADPHCPVCGRDTALEWENPEAKWKLAICVWCLTEKLGDIGVITKLQN